MLQQIGSKEAQDRIKSAFGVAILHSLLAYAFITGLGVHIGGGPDHALKTFDVRVPDPPPPLAEAISSARKDPEGAASPANLKARPAPIAAPEPRVRIKEETPIPASATPETGSDSSAGASDRPGPGRGSGGVGDGTGSGRSGTGAGGGGAATKARLIAGRIVDSDYPRAASRAHAEGVVTVRFTVGTDGHARGCRVTGSSGNADLDETTCRLIERRFRYEPARDRDGRPVPVALGWRQSWWQE